MKSNGDHQPAHGPAGNGSAGVALLDSVRGQDGHEAAPCPTDQIAWQYLAPDKRMRRWTETIEILDLGSSHRKITIDFSLPDGEKQRQWMLPTAYLGKWPVAPDLEVVDAGGGAISVPTKRENMAITAAALDGLAAAKVISFADAEIRDLCRQVVFGANFEARVARLVAEERLGPKDVLLRRLLGSLEDQFLLWVPVVGEPGCDQQISIHRRQELDRDPILVAHRVVEERTVHTAAGPIRVNFMPAKGPRRPNMDAAVSRVLRLFGLTPYEYGHETAEASRFASFHLRVSAPEGMAVRDVGLRILPNGAEPSDPEALTEAPPSKEGFSYRGHDRQFAHFHCARPQNPPVLSAFVTFALRGDLTSFWAGAAVFTTLLLWAIHRQAPANLASTGALDSAVAILLIGPAVASSWAIRADRGDLLEGTLSGARACLLTSALLSVSVALSLAGFRPFHWSSATAIEVYASLSYGVTALIVIGWAVTLSVSWLLYRDVLTSASRNYIALFLVAALAAAVCAHPHLPLRLVGLTLLGAGLFMAAIAAHPGRAVGAATAGPPVAALGAAATLLGAGWFLGFYEDLATRESLRAAVLLAEGILMSIAAVQWYRST